MKVLSEKYDIYIVTSRHLVECSYWVTISALKILLVSGLIHISTDLSKIFTLAIFGIAMEEKCMIMNLLQSRTKKDMCLKIGASVLIDDNWNYCHEVAFSIYCQ